MERFAIVEAPGALRACFLQQEAVRWFTLCNVIVPQPQGIGDSLASFLSTGPRLPVAYGQPQSTAQEETPKHVKAEEGVGDAILRHAGPSPGHGVSVIRVIQSSNLAPV